MGNELQTMAALAAAASSSSGNITLRDSFKSTDVVGGTKVVCTRSIRATNVSHQKIGSDGGRVRVDLLVHQRAGGMVILGVVGVAADDDSLGTHVCGESEINPSLGCGIRNEEVFILHKDKFIFRGACNTSDPTRITMIMEDGKLAFQIDGRNVNSDELRSLGLKGDYRVGVSTDTAGQVAQLTAFAGEVKASGNAASDIKFRDTFRSTDVEGHVIRCNRDVRATNITERHMPTQGNKITVKVKVERLAGGIVCLGIVGKSVDRDELANHICGEKEISPSLGCGIHKDEVFVLLRDKILFRGSCNTSDPTRITMIMDNGKLTFRIDDKELDCDDLAKTKLEGDFHIGISTASEGQVVRLESVDVDKVGGGGSDGSKRPGMFGDVPAPFMLTEDKEFTLEVPRNTGIATIKSGTAISRAPGDVVVTKEHVKAGSHNGVICDMCYAGVRHGEDDGEQFCQNRWKCSICDDYDVCNSCFSQNDWKHSHPRRKFRVVPGGCFFECRMKVEAGGDPFVLAVIAAGSESRFACGVSSEFTVTPKAAGTIPVAVRVLKGKAVFLAHSRILGSTDLPEAPAYRFGVRFGGIAQRVTLQPRGRVPPRGSEVLVTSDADALEAETKVIPEDVGLRTHCAMAGLKGHALQASDDGTVRVQIDDGRKLWFPIGALVVEKPRVAPIFGVLAEGMEVVRNPLGWKWGRQDGGTPGKVIEEVKDGWVRVRWQSGETNNYRFGKDGMYDVIPYPGVGSVVVRNPAFWKSGSKDGGAGKPGRVEERSGRAVHVLWEGKSSPTEHVFSALEHEVWLAPPGTSIGGKGATVEPIKRSSKTAQVDVVKEPEHKKSSPSKPVHADPVPLCKTSINPVKAARLSAWQEDSKVKFLAPVKGVAAAPKMSLEDAIDADEELKAADLSSVVFIAKLAVEETFRDGPPHGMSVDEAASIHAFTQESEMYRIQGAALRCAKRERLKPMFPLLRLQFGALAKLPRPESPLTVYRGIPNDVHETFSDGSKHMWWGMTSTTRSIKVMEAFADGGGTLFMIEALDLVNIESLSALPGEEEHILFPGTTLRVKGVVDTGRYWMVQLVQIKAPMMVDMLPPHPAL